MPIPTKAKVEDRLSTINVEDRLSVELLTCELFPQKYDFRTVCSCGECLPKIRDLKNFERFLESTYRMVLELSSCCARADEECDYIVYVCDWSERTLDSFYNSLKEVYDELGEEFIGGKGLKHKIEIMKLLKSLAESGLFPNYNVPAAELVNKTTCAIAKYVDVNIRSCGMEYFKCTKFAEEGENLLNKILQIEAEHQNAKKYAADNGKRLHPSISKDYIQQQIECVESLPVKGLRTEAEACIAKVSDIIPILDYLCDAKNLIDLTSMVMKDVRKAFWRKYKRKREGERGHKLTGLSTTLDLLLEKAAAFHSDWENRFAQYIPPPSHQPKDN